MRVSAEKLKGIRPRPAREVLLKLAELAQKLREKPDSSAHLPKVSIDTAQGFHFEGAVLGVEERPGVASVLLEHETPSGSQRSLVVSYLELTEPFHLTMLEAEYHLALLRFGEVPRLSSDGPLSALNLKRHLEQARGQLSTAFGIQLEISDRLTGEDGLANNVVRDAVEFLRQHLEKTRQDEIGATALQAVKKISLRFAESAAPRFSKSGSELTFELDPREGISSRDELAASFDSAL